MFKYIRVCLCCISMSVYRTVWHIVCLSSRPTDGLAGVCVQGSPFLASIVAGGGAVNKEHLWL